MESSSNVKNFDKIMKNSCIKQDIRDEKGLLKNMWVYINPNCELSIPKEFVFDFLLLIMFNVCH